MMQKGPTDVISPWTTRKETVSPALTQFSFLFGVDKTNMRKVFTVLVVCLLKALASNGNLFLLKDDKMTIGGSGAMEDQPTPGE